MLTQVNALHLSDYLLFNTTDQNNQILWSVAETLFFWKCALLTVATLEMVSLPLSGCSVAQKTTEQANIIADTAVAGANDVAQSAVEGVENAAMASGLVKSVSGASNPTH